MRYNSDPEYYIRDAEDKELALIAFYRARHSPRVIWWFGSRLLLLGGFLALLFLFTILVIILDSMLLVLLSLFFTLSLLVCFLLLPFGHRRIIKQAYEEELAELKLQLRK